MNEDLVAINDEIEMLMEEPPTMEKYQRLGVLFVCKKHIEDLLKSNKTTIAEILTDRADKIGARATIVRLAPVLADFVKDIERISPTMSGGFIKKLKEM